MKRNKREHGRILSVETLIRGDALAADVAAGATSITVNDAGDFDEDGGWLIVGAQMVEYVDCDDDTGVIILADPLTAAGEEGDPVHVWSDLYAEVVDYQLAHVELDGEYDNPDPVVAEVAEGVGDLPEGDRGKAGESCTLLRVADDEWEVVGVGGRSRKSRGLRFEQDDTYTLTADDITAGTVSMPLSHRPANEALTCVLAGVPQRPTAWTINYDAEALTMPLGGWEKAGDVLWVHYAYRKGITTPQAEAPVEFVGWNENPYGVAYTSLALPTGTQVGDLVLFSAAGPGLTVTDPRLTLESGHWVGTATTLDPLAVSGSYSNGVMAFRGATALTTTVLTGPSPLTIPAMAAGAVGISIVAGGTTGHGSVAITAGYTLVGQSPAYINNNMVIGAWWDGSGPSPATTAVCTMSDANISALIVKLK